MGANSRQRQPQPVIVSIAANSSRPAWRRRGEIGRHVRQLADAACADGRLQQQDGGQQKDNEREPEGKMRDCFDINVASKLPAMICLQRGTARSWRKPCFTN
jgi:hypothetical protein